MRPGRGAIEFMIKTHLSTFNLDNALVIRLTTNSYKLQNSYKTTGFYKPHLED